MSLFNQDRKGPETLWTFEHGVLEALVAGVEEGVIVYDKDFRVVHLNQAAAKLFGIEASEVIGQIFSLEQAKNFRSKVMAQIMFSALAPVVVRRSEPGAYPQVIDLSLEKPPLELRVITNQVADLGKRLTGFVKIIRDRTRELDLLRAKSDFVTIAAHQLRTPTTGMTWALTALAKETNLSKDGQEALVIARKTASHLATVIDELIGLAQLEEGKFGYQFKKTALEPFLDKLLGELQVVAQEYQVALYFERPGESDLTAEIDPARLAVAVAALVDNAIKYNVPNGKVTVGMKKLADKSYLEISVKDTGIGIEADDLKKLFTKFFRGKGAEKSAAAGSGLGLYLAKNIINRHGGEIVAESEPGRGTTFRFTIPTDPKLIPAGE